MPSSYKILQSLTSTTPLEVQVSPYGNLLTRNKDFTYYLTELFSLLDYKIYKPHEVLQSLLKAYLNTKTIGYTAWLGSGLQNEVLAANLRTALVEESDPMQMVIEMLNSIKSVSAESRFIELWNVFFSHYHSYALQLTNYQFKHQLSLVQLDDVYFTSILKEYADSVLVDKKMFEPEIECQLLVSTNTLNQKLDDLVEQIKNTQEQLAAFEELDYLMDSISNEQLKTIYYHCELYISVITDSASSIITKSIIAFSSNEVINTLLSRFKKLAENSDRRIVLNHLLVAATVNLDSDQVESYLLPLFCMKSSPNISARETIQDFIQFIPHVSASCLEKKILPILILYLQEGDLFIFRQVSKALIMIENEKELSEDRVIYASVCKKINMIIQQEIKNVIDTLPISKTGLTDANFDYLECMVVNASAEILQEKVYPIILKGISSQNHRYRASTYRLIQHVSVVNENKFPTIFQLVLLEKLFDKLMKNDLIANSELISAIGCVFKFETGKKITIQLYDFILHRIQFNAYGELNEAMVELLVKIIEAEKVEPNISLLKDIIANTQSFTHPIYEAFPASKNLVSILLDKINIEQLKKLLPQLLSQLTFSNGFEFVINQIIAKLDIFERLIYTRELLKSYNDPDSDKNLKAKILLPIYFLNKKSYESDKYLIAAESCEIELNACENFSGLKIEEEYKSNSCKTV